MTPIEARALMSILQAAWPSAKWPPDTVALYRSSLESMDHAAACRTVHALVESEKWLPSIGQIAGPVRIVERAMRAETRPLDCGPREAQSAEGWLALARDVIAGRRQPPCDVQLELWEEGLRL